MKCIRCGTDNNLKDRTGNYGRCKNCEHPFVFEPNIMGKISFTDPFSRKHYKIYLSITPCFLPLNNYFIY
jgi:hypothetical protein